MDATTAKPQADPIAWANETALAIHGVEQLADLGTDGTRYRKKFVLKYRNNHGLKAKQYLFQRHPMSACHCLSLLLQVGFVGTRTVSAFCNRMVVLESLDDMTNDACS